MTKTNTPQTNAAIKSGPRPRKAKAAPALDAPTSAEAPKQPKAPRGKLGVVVDLLSRPEGATIDAIVKATGWQTHSVRGAMSGALKKKHGFAIVSEKTDAGRIYRIQDAASA